MLFEIVYYSFVDSLFPVVDSVSFFVLLLSSVCFFCASQLFVCLAPFRSTFLKVFVGYSVLAEFCIPSHSISITWNIFRWILILTDHFSSYSVFSHYNVHLTLFSSIFNQHVLHVHSYTLFSHHNFLQMPWNC